LVWAQLKAGNIKVKMKKTERMAMYCFATQEAEERTPPLSRCSLPSRNDPGRFEGMISAFRHPCGRHQN
jgi:hypothetical protein